MPYGANVDDGTFYRIEGLTAGSLNADLVPAMDVSAWNWMTLTIGPDGYTGQLSWQGSTDLAFTNPQYINMYEMSRMVSAASSATNLSNIVVGAPVVYPYFRVRMIGYTSGDATGILDLRKNGPSGFQMLQITTNIADSLYSRIGLTNNDGLTNFAVAAGVSSDTVIIPGFGFLSHLLVTATGTHEMDIYDNATTGSGMIIAIIPASAAVGTIVPCKAIFGNGITIKGDMNNPGITGFYTWIS